MIGVNDIINNSQLLNVVYNVLKIQSSEINDNRLQYRMHKNSKLISMKIPVRALEIKIYIEMLKSITMISYFQN